MHRLRDLLYPELRRLPPPERARAWRRARRAPFDAIELIGIAFALVLVTALTGYGAAQLDPAERLLAALLNAGLALPLLALLVGPFLVRRTRRALRLPAPDGTR